METQHRKSSLTGTCDLSSGDVIAWGGSWEIYISLTSLLRSLAGAFWWPNPTGSQRAREPFHAVPIRHTQKRKRCIWRGKKKRELFSTVTMKIAQIYPDLRQTIWKIVLGFFPPWTTTYTNRFLDEILITSTSSIFAETEKASFPAQILSIRLSLATRNRKPD